MPKCTYDGKNGHISYFCFIKKFFETTMKWTPTSTSCFINKKSSN